MIHASDNTPWGIRNTFWPPFWRVFRSFFAPESAGFGAGSWWFTGLFVVVLLSCRCQFGAGIAPALSVFVPHFSLRRFHLPLDRDPIADLKVVQSLRRKVRRRRYYSSRLDPVRSYIEDQLMAGASYQDVAWSLRMFRRIKVDQSTIRRAVNRWQADAETPP
jgi:hypothetical protein